jgi:hypothetical protein
MMRRILCAFVLFASLAATASAQDWATKMFETTSHDFGSIARGAKAEFEFVLSNIYLEDVHIASVHSSCGCTDVEIKQPATLKTYEKGAIVARINSRAFMGQRGATLTVVFDKPFYAEVQLHDSVYIRSDVVFNPGSVDMGAIDQGTALDRQVDVSYAGRSDWQIVGVKSANPHLSGQLLETQRSGGLVSYRLKVRLDGKAPAGYLRDYLTLTTNDFQSPQIPLAVEGMVQPGVTVSPSSLFMGVVHPGEKVTKQLVVRAKKPFRITSISCEDKSFQFDAAKEDTPKLVHLIPVTYVAGTDPGKVLKMIRIETDLKDQLPELSAYAVVSR